MVLKVHRRYHQERADRLEARFSNPVPTNQPGPTAPNPAPAAPTLPLPVPVPTPPARQPQPVLPSPVQVPPTQPQTLPNAPPQVPSALPSVSVASPSSSVAAPVVPVVPVAPSSPSSSSIVQPTPSIVTLSSSKPVLPATLTTFRSLPADTFTPTLTSSASVSATSAASSGMGTGSIVGIAAAGIAGVAVIGAAGIWLMRRYFASRDEEPEFQRHSWMRNSIALPDDSPSPLARGPSENPRPPTMIERSQTRNYANVPRGGYGQGAYAQDPNAGMAYSGNQGPPYGAAPMPAFDPSQHYPGSAHNSSQPFFSPIASPSPSPGSPAMMSFDDTMPAMQHASYSDPSGYFSRHDSSVSGASGLDDGAMPNPHDSAGGDGYTTLDRSSVTPYQAQQYAAISQQLRRDQVLASVAEAAAMGSQGPSPFEDSAANVSATAIAAPGDMQEHEELPYPAPAHQRIDSTPPALPPMRAMSPVGAVSHNHTSFAQFATAPAPTFPPAAAAPSSPRSPTSSSFKQPPPLSPAPGAQMQLVNVPDVHKGRETPVQFGFNASAASAPAAVNVPAVAPTSAPVAEARAARRMSVVPAAMPALRPETMYDEEDAYGGI
ncbi:hypothetical protein K439DRAFT_1552416 [Ramaria rubella]|nr:hypothetical protein K439DRAFT_1552416 [Ramaria rubella]